MPKPLKPDRPVVTVEGLSTLRIAWVIPEAEPEITACSVGVRIQGNQRYQNYDHETGRLVPPKLGSTVPAPTCEITVDGCEEGLAYEAIVAMKNEDGWGAPSLPSEPTIIGEAKPREKPPAPAPPVLKGVSSGRLKVSWTLPRACPPVEAAQIQVTDVAKGARFLVDATNGKLVASGKTTFAASRTETNIVGTEDGVEYVAAVCCRNAEGFGDYSMDSDSVATAPVGGEAIAATSMALVLAESVPSEVPTLEPLNSGKMRVRWSMPEEAKSTAVKIRKAGASNWSLFGGSTIPAPDSETVASGLEEGIEYEATVSFLVNGRWTTESQVSKPACIGELLLPGPPGVPKKPKLFVVDQHQCHMRVMWDRLTAVPSVTGILVKFRPLGARQWQYVSPATCHVTSDEPEVVAAPITELDVLGVQPGVLYEASIHCRNKLGQGPESPPSDLVCIGRPAQRLMKCTNCFADFDLQHAEYTKSPECFWCLPCRFRQMDPFNAIVEPYGVLMQYIVMRPQAVFSLPLPDVRTWRRDDHSVFMRMVRVDSDNCAQVWPRRLTFEANGHQVFAIKEPEEGHVRRDVPKDISSSLRPGLNTFNITMEDDYLPGYAMALVRTQGRTAQQIAPDIPFCDEETAKGRVMSLLADTWGTGTEEEDDIICVISNTLKLRCPLSFERVVIPVRGEQCMHLQCFGLGAYLESNMKMRALNNRWTCPVCGNVLRPGDLRIDGYVERVLQETPNHIDEVMIMQDGSYCCIEEEGFEKAEPSKEREAEATRPPHASVGATPEIASPQAEEGEVTELPTTVEDVVDGQGKKRHKPMPVVHPVLTKRQRRRRLLTVGQQSENDSN